MASESEIKRQILKKLKKRMMELGFTDNVEPPELKPDVIVISGDQSLLFEPQNMKASEVLHQCCGLVSIDGAERHERIRVHPGRSREIIDDLRTAGLTVV
jgi:hypothetical protein